jgi:putative oxygen-independent coproporphyrinogen III oxidase
VHLPWCERKCPYCDFNSHEATEIPEAAYVDALLEDLRDEYAGERRPLNSIFIGGGTPSLFSAQAINRLLDGFRSIAELATNAEITLEANPGSSDNERLAGFAHAGVTRFSIGVQSFDDGALARLGRIHDGHTAHAAVQAAANSGAQSFNLDLMHGLPGQGSDDGLADIDAALALAPPHLSWYQLTIEPNTRFYSDRPTLPAEDVLLSLEDEGARRLQSAGYERYEVSAWAQPGQECRHNLNYWQFGDYLAIGAGAHGKLTKDDGRILRYAKTRIPADYLRPGGRSRVQPRELDAADLRGEFILNALRLREGFTRELFEARTGLAASALEPELARLRADKLLEEAEGHVRCTPLGWRFLDEVVARFF